MNRSEELSLLVLLAFGVILAVGIISVIAGNITNQVFSGFPSISDPMGAAVALTVFVGILLKIAELVFGGQ